MFYGKMQREEIPEISWYLSKIVTEKNRHTIMSPLKTGKEKGARGPLRSTQFQIGGRDRRNDHVGREKKGHEGEEENREQK